MRLFHSQKSVSHRTSQQTKGLRQVPSKFFLPISVQGVPLPPFHPIPPPHSVTPLPPRLDDFSRLVLSASRRHATSAESIGRRSQLRLLTMRGFAYARVAPGFFEFCCKHSTSSQSTLGLPLRHAWVALGPRLGHPRATQSQTQSPVERHRQRVATPKCENPASAGSNHSCSTAALAVLLSNGLSL